MRRDRAERIANHRGAVEFAAHLLAWLRRIDRLTTTVGACRDTWFCQIAHDLVTESVPRHEEDAGEIPANERWRGTLPPGSRLTESDIDRDSLYRESGWRRRDISVEVGHNPCLMRPYSFVRASASGLRDIAARAAAWGAIDATCSSSACARRSRASFTVASGAG
jgi:hypothetical protein